jgi:ProP effector
MGFEQLAALKAQLTKEAKLKKQHEQQAQPAPKPADQRAANKAPRPAAKEERPSRPARPGGPARADGRPARAGEKARGADKAPPVDPVVRVIGKLQKRFPAAFPKNPAPKVPLKVGILADLIAQGADLQLTEAEIREAVSTWCRGSRYWACLTDGAARVDLAGEPAGVVTARDAAFARNQAKGGAGGRRKARGKSGAASAESAAAAEQAQAAPAEANAAEAKGNAADAEGNAAEAEANAAEAEGNAAEAEGNAADAEANAADAEGVQPASASEDDAAAGS